MSSEFISFRWQITPKTFHENWQRYSLGRRLVLKTETERLAKMLEAEMKQNAPWDDRTGRARQSLTADVITRFIDRYLAIDLYYKDVDYGYYLETMGNGAYAIVGPTLMKYRMMVVSELARAFREKGIIRRP